LRGRLVFAWRADGPSGPAGRALVERARTALGGPSRPASGSATG
ncbi:LysR family transcriptional regulator, partial [Streptomyces sp. NPDC022067]